MTDKLKKAVCILLEATEEELKDPDLNIGFETAGGGPVQIGDMTWDYEQPDAYTVVMSGWGWGRGKTYNSMAELLNTLLEIPVD